MDEHVELISDGRRKKRGKVLCGLAITGIIVAVSLGLLVGYAVWRREKHVGGPAGDEKADYRKRYEEMLNHHKDFQKAISEERLENTLKYLTKQPHIAGSRRQKALADELANRWVKYGFDDVEMPEYRVLMSFPNTTNPTRITLKYKNGTIIHQVKPEEQVTGEEVMAFLAYSPNGKVEGELVYVNYGQVGDFEKLKTLGVNVTGKIAIMRYGKIFRGDKVYTAANYGAKAALLYSDPGDVAQAGGDPKDTYPNTPWLPTDGVQRGSLYIHGGDPLTPGLPAIPGMYRRPQNESKLPPIPAHPLGYGDAMFFLSRIGGKKAPKEWRGGLKITYRLGPSFTDRDITVSVDVNNYNEVKSTFQVIGTIYGSVEPDRYILLGNHRDAWVYGAVDPSSGTTVITEIARALGGLKKAGWQPRRTVKVCSWGSEEYGIVGSREWVEEHEKRLAERAVIYINTDSSVDGNFLIRMLSTPLVKHTMREFSKTVMDPRGRSMFDIAAERNPEPQTDPPEPAVGRPGAGSDYLGFYQYVGVSAVDFRYFGFNRTFLGYPMYHSKYETFEYVKKFVDPEFKYHKAATQFLGGFLLLFADSPLLNMSVVVHGDALNGSLHALKRDYSVALKGHRQSFSLLEGAIKKFQGVAAIFTKAKNEMERKLAAFDEPTFAELRRLNDRMIQTERAFIYSYGLPGRRLVRNVFLANSKYNQYGASSFPGIRDALYSLKETGNHAEVDLQLSIAAQAVLSAVDLLSGPF